jgi:mannose-6-phosphate isomerase-like protein (cupin superfamily)
MQVPGGAAGHRATAGAYAGASSLRPKEDNLMRSDQISPPSRVLREDIRMQTETADGLFTAGIAIDGKSHNSPLRLGLDWIQPGAEEVSWETDAQTHEVHYLQQGRVRIGWAGHDADDVELSAGDAFYFPPGRKYKLQNIGETQAVIVWSAVPSPT